MSNIFYFFLSLFPFKYGSKNILNPLYSFLLNFITYTSSFLKNNFSNFYKIIPLYKPSSKLFFSPKDNFKINLKKRKKLPIFPNISNAENFVIKYTYRKIKLNQKRASFYKNRYFWLVFFS